MTAPVRASAPLWAIVCLALPACSTCSGDPVPFGLDSGLAGASVPDPLGPGPSREAPIRIEEIPGGAARVDVGGAPLEMPGHLVRAVGVWDLDGALGEDAVAITMPDPAAATGSGPRVVVAMRQADGTLASPLEVLALAPLAEGCAIEGARFTPLPGTGDDRGLLITELQIDCPPDEHGSAARLVAVAIGRERTPRARERFELRARSFDGRSDALSLRLEDRDQDGHPDLVLELALADALPQAISEVELTFLDRPAGLAREPAEPEHTIAALAQEARTALRRHPDRALEKATAALNLWEAICREGGRPRVSIGGAVGLACGRSAGAGRALAILVQAAVRRDLPLVALAAMERLSTREINVSDADRQAAAEALAALPQSGLEVHESVALEGAIPGGARLSRLGFLDEGRLLIRGDPSRIVDLTSNTEQPGEARSLAMLDPAGAHRLVAVERRCEGTVVVIGPADPTLDGIQPSTTALVATRQAPAGAPCPGLTPVLRADDDGWRALGWAPQGILLGRERELRLVALDLEGNAVGGPAELALDAVVPAPIEPGQASRDVRFWVEATAAGLRVITLSPPPVDPGAPPARRIDLVRPPGWTAPDGSPIDVAISPSGRRIAWIAGGHVRWIERS